ncbi:MAG TPA: DPP IV N-terminal domain-containing protein, partial [Niabella sp.]|nr:DPP IV N-terminal domain-containing protein [Niabella sp.]
MFRKFLCFCLMLLGFMVIHAQSVNWGADGNTYYKIEDGAIVKYTLPQNSKAVLVAASRLTPSGSTQPIDIRSFVVSKDESKVLIYNNTRQVWREDTRGDYWVLDLASGRLQQLGKGKPEASLMFAKLSPDNTKVAYVSEYNLYVEDLASGTIKALTTDGNRKNINGTFDWAYEEEFFCRDGFRWAPDSRKIAYWKIIAGDTKVYNMVNNTDSIYPRLIPIEYPVAGEKPSVFKIGVVSLSDAQTKWMNIADDAVWGSYVPRMEWAGNNSELIVQHLNRRQNESNLILCNAASGAVQTIYTEKDSAWIDIVANWDQDYT